MTREEALSSVEANVENRNLVKHMLATEAIMRALARHFGEDEDEWGLAGLLHDIDVELTGGSEEMVHAILCHNEAHGIACEALMDKALFCADPITGLITAAALVRPDKKLAGVEAKSVRKRFKEKSFAAGARRENIAACSALGLELDQFIDISLKAMQDVAEDLGL
jgi:putative nucleotidyltransferase with HDIG domain